MDQLLFILDHQYPYLILNKKFLVIYKSVYNLNTGNINPNQVNLLKVKSYQLLDEVLPFFKKSEDYQHDQDEYHGKGGELKVQERRVNWEILDAWRDAAAETGIPKIAEFNRGNNFGNAYFQMKQLMCLVH